MAVNCPGVIAKRVRLCPVGIGGVYSGEHGTDLFTTPPSSPAVLSQSHQAGVGQKRTVRVEK